MVYDDLYTTLSSVFAGALAATVATGALMLVRPVTPASRRVRQRQHPLARAGLAAVPMSVMPATSWALGGDPGTIVVAGLVALAFDAAWLPVSRAWSWRGHAAWSAGTALTSSYLVFALVATLSPEAELAGVLGGLLLWVVECLALLMGLAYLWEVVDVSSRRSWPRRDPHGAVALPARPPFVSLHVPAHNEPPDMVIDTLTALLALDYPSYEIVMVDDNTDDTALWHPVRDFCAERGIRFAHLQDWPGYKSGALNYALEQATDPRAEVIGVIDADYIVDSDYLLRCASLFADRPQLAFVQSPQDYRGWKGAAYYRRLYHSYDYFFAVSQACRNELNAPIFGGTMGLIRRSALEAVGGWDEWCITEDAELSLRLLKVGWEGQHVERSFGHGVMPLTFEALKRQRFRWCFGGIQILRMHGRSLMPWNRSPANRLTPAQRWAYLSGGLQWYADLIGLVFATFVAIGTLDHLLGDGAVLRRLPGLLLLLPLTMLTLAVIRSVVVLRQQTDANLKDAVGALGIWLSCGWATAQGSVRGLIERQGVFLRTPKTKDHSGWREAARANVVETVSGTGLLVLAVAAAASAGVIGSVMAALLAWHGAALLGAPLNSLAAARADVPVDLRLRKAGEWLRDRVPARVRVTSVAAVLGLVVAASVVGLALLTPAVAPGGPATDALLPVEDVPPSPGPGSAPSTGSTTTDGGPDTESPSTPTSSAPPSPATTAGPGTSGPAPAPTAAPSAVPPPPPPSPTAAPAPAPTAPTATQRPPAPTPTQPPAPTPTQAPAPPQDPGAPSVRPTPTGRP